MWEGNLGWQVLPLYYIPPSSRTKLKNTPQSYDLNVSLDKSTSNYQGSMRPYFHAGTPVQGVEIRDSGCGVAQIGRLEAAFDGDAT
jgi:hypothetical protein